MVILTLDQISITDLQIMVEVEKARVSNPTASLFEVAASLADLGLETSVRSGLGSSDLKQCMHVLRYSFIVIHLAGQFLNK
jgi:hypothetical protein